MKASKGFLLHSSSGSSTGSRSPVPSGVVLGTTSTGTSVSVSSGSGSVSSVGCTVNRDGGTSVGGASVSPTVLK